MATRFEPGVQYVTWDGEPIKVTSRKRNTIRYKDKDGKFHTARVTQHFGDERNIQQRISSRLTAMSHAG